MGKKKDKNFRLLVQNCWLHDSNHKILIKIKSLNLTSKDRINLKPKIVRDLFWVKKSFCGKHLIILWVSLNNVMI